MIIKYNDMAKKMIPLSRLTTKAKDANSVGKRRNEWGTKRNIQLLNKCQQLWYNNENVRATSERCKRYVYGDQWGDITQYKGTAMTERDYIVKQGNIPLVNNLMRKLVNNVVGLYTKGETEPIANARDRDEQQLGEMMTITLQANWQLNKMPILLSSVLEDFLTGGVIFERESPDFINNRFDIFSTAPNPNYMFYDGDMNDPRFWDLRIIGEIHDCTFRELITKFAKKPEDVEKLKGIYSNVSKEYDATSYIDPQTKYVRGHLNFYTPVSSELCRVIEVWTKEVREYYRCHDYLEGEIYRVELGDLDKIKKENEERVLIAAQNGIPEDDVATIEYEYMVGDFWFVQHLAPDGTIIYEGETPFWHQSHPYTMCAYPFINGQIHPFALDFLDQQRYINRLIMMDDFVRRAGAKGVTMVPTDVLGGMAPEEFAEQWSSYDGLIFYTPKQGTDHRPEQIFSHSTSLGIPEMIQLQINLMNDISVQSSLQGKQPYAGTSAALYAQQSANATTSLHSLMLRFSSFVEDLAMKKTKLIQQYYTDKRVVSIAGKTYAGIKEYIPEKVRDVDMDVSIKESTSTPTSRMFANDFLMQLWQKGAISVQQLLKNGDFPFADGLLQNINSAQEATEAGIPQVQQNISGAIPERVNAASEMLKQAPPSQA